MPRDRRTSLCASPGWRIRRDVFCRELLSASEDGGHDARAAPCVYDSDNPQRLFLRRVGDQVLTYQNEAQRARGEVLASVAGTGERYKIIYGLNYSRNHAVGSVGIIRRNELPNFVEVGPDFRVEIISNH